MYYRPTMAVTHQSEIHRSFDAFCKQYASHSVSQIKQDLFVIFATSGKRDGYFVEFGAADGIFFSNTYMLEKYGWKGLLAEPARRWKKPLLKNRQVVCDTRCVWSTSGEMIEFVEPHLAELATAKEFSTCDHYGSERADRAETYEVETISLNDLLREHAAPKKIDYMSIDTEGSEFRILEQFDFTKHEVGIFTIEHNFTEQRAAIERLLKSVGFYPVFQDLSQWDSWFLNQRVYHR